VTLAHGGPGLPRSRERVVVSLPFFVFINRNTHRGLPPQAATTPWIVTAVRESAAIDAPGAARASRGWVTGISSFVRRGRRCSPSREGLGRVRTRSPYASVVGGRLLSAPEQAGPSVGADQPRHADSWVDSREVPARPARPMRGAQAWSLASPLRPRSLLQRSRSAPKDRSCVFCAVLLLWRANRRSRLRCAKELTIPPVPYFVADGQRCNLQLGR
jgi:hypothetical protein